MILEKEDFNKLKQLDRIEYRQKLRLIKERTEIGCFWSLTKTYILVSLFCISFGILLMAINQDYTETAKALIQIVYKLIWMPILGWFCDIFILFRRANKLNELQKEYFEVKTK